MKTIPPVPPQMESGRTYWRSLDQLAETPEFRQWLENEFPEGATEWTDPVSRRHFVKIMSASFLLAGLGLAGTGCRRPEQKIVPFGQQPEGYVHGVPQFYATAMPTRGDAIPLVVRSNDGRPTKIEGNGLHPNSNGGTDRYAQASILNLYDPDRATRFLKDGNMTTPESAIDFLSGLSNQLQRNEGRGLAILAEQNNSPSRRRLQQELFKRMPQAKWYSYEAAGNDIHDRAAAEAFGRPVKPLFLLDRAKIIVSLDSDFLGTEDNVSVNIQRYSAGRRLEGPQDTLNRVYAVESLMTITGGNADHRLRVPSSVVGQVAAALADRVITQGGLNAAAQVGQPAGVNPQWIEECAKDLVAHRGECVVLVGQRQPLAVHLLAYAMNAALGNLGKTVVLQERQSSPAGNLVELAQALNGGQVETLVILGCNPVYNAPADLDWATTQKKAKTVVRLSHYEDETTTLCNWSIPAAHYLESWGDGLSNDGTLVPIQPLISPLFGGLTELEVLARLIGSATVKPHDIVQQTFTGFIGGKQDPEAWKRFLHDGFLPNSGLPLVNAQVNTGAAAAALANFKPVVPSKDQLEVVFHLDYSLDDGRYNNNGWLQELPDPITKMTWDNAVLMSRQTAVDLGVKNNDLVDITLGGRTVRGPVWIQPGMANYSLGLALGYGRGRTGRVGTQTGFNVYPLRTSTGMGYAVGATVKAVGKTYPISCTQDHWSMEGRPIIREANLEQYRKQPDFAKKMNAEEAPVHKSLYPNPLDHTEQQALHQWGMSIDLNLCVGCSSCVLACQSENNVPIVGKDQVKRGREMHWLRIDRYYAGNTDEFKYLDSYRLENKQQLMTWADEPQMLTQPMLCQHCEAAPCESVCPVNATVHDHEGLNVMAYNRCVGTRYCSNNCPYKVRRFNYFDYNKRPLNALYKGPLARREEDEWDLLKMIKNPDVTVRMRGVMEKCTFCVQRIESAKISQKVKAGASGDVVVPEGTFTTACAQACPSGAIVFGNLKDPNSRVSKLKQRDRDYSVLDLLLTKPRLTYLARVRNPNPKMPDYKDVPLSYELYEKKMGTKHDEAGHKDGHSSPSDHSQKGGH